MKFYDLCLRTENPKALEMAKKLGFSGVGVIFEYQQGVFEKIHGLRNIEGVCFGIELKKDIRHKAKDMRKNIELIAAKIEDREAVETPEVDILFPSQLNYIMVRLAKKNNVAIGFDFNAILHSSKRTRSELLSSYLQTARMVRKYRAPFIITSGAKSSWDIRSPSELISFGKVLGFNEKDSIMALSDAIIRENKKRLEKGWILPGVKKE